MQGEKEAPEALEIDRELRESRGKIPEKNGAFARARVRERARTRIAASLGAPYLADRADRRRRHATPAPAAMPPAITAHCHAGAPPMSDSAHATAQHA